MLIGMFGTGSRDLDRVIRNAFAGGEDGIWVAPRLGGMFQDAALATPWAADGDPVGGYVDRSPRGYTLTQATSTKRPTGYGDRMYGDGADDLLDGGDILDIHAGDMFAVVAARFATASPSQAIFGKISGNGVGGRYAIVRRNPDGQIAAQFSPVSSAAQASGPIDTSTDLRVFSLRVDRAAGSLSLRVNGADLASTSWTPSFTDLDPSLAFRLFGRASNDQYFNGDINELVQVMRAPAAGEIEAIEARLIVAHAVETGGG